MSTNGSRMTFSLEFVHRPYAVVIHNNTAAALFRTCEYAYASGL